ncbi:uncharacterized protein K444DRAFT_618295 [Hyaloscypha bicolor E]|uniref:Uncharacterized protein n=1 Tax=Hyaloscypha bicolor E TaxID=1095630 RepID=A0A2J6SUM2_9HELO|nr:uncharacterized protein K444DRAFT_618295 [Hyaloscypha bicolor E]PMD54474.1 hypothetical protein K444DRAFT_618295 [Hyaloscypha bicolor E]
MELENIDIEKGKQNNPSEFLNLWMPKMETPSTKGALEAILEVLSQEVGGDEERRDGRRALRRMLFWWIFNRISVLLSLMTLAKFTLVPRMRMKKIRWLENPCAFDTGNLLRGLQF